MRKCLCRGSKVDIKPSVAHLKSQDMAFFMVVLSQMPAYWPVAMSWRAAQQSAKVPTWPSNTFLRTPSFASCRGSSGSVMCVSVFSPSRHSPAHEAIQSLACRKIMMLVMVLIM